MFKIRGKTEKGDSITGTSGAESFADAADEVEKAAESAGDAVTQLSIKTMDGGAGVKIAKPRKRDAASGGGKKGKGSGK